MENTFKNKLYILLKKDSRLWGEEKKELDETLLKDLIDKLDEKLIELLLGSKETKEEFFIKIKDVYVLKQNEFKFFIDENKLDNSYTQYQNKIGLRVGNKLLKERDEVVLDWPFKDCVLEGGMTKEDQKRNEIFFNEVLAKDEIDRLFDPKALVNWKRYTVKGEKQVKELERDKDGTIRENLIIKGNNLLALHSLKEQFFGKVKLIYIDPPFNRDADTFYNDNFKHSTWLTFMKNRLKVAKDLLRDDGIIFIQCDNNEVSHLKVLMDEIKKITFVNIISVKSSTPSGVKTSHADKTILKSQDFILVYKRPLLKFNPQYIRKKSWDTHYMFFIQEKDRKLRLLKLVDVLYKKNILFKKERLEDFNINNKKHRDFYLKFGHNIIRKSTHDNKEIKLICNTKYKNKIYRDKKGNFYLGNDMLQPISRSFHEVLIGQNIEKDISNVLCDFWNDIDFQNTQNQGGVSLPAGKKPEQLLYRIIKLATREGDIVLDYHLGSGTTCAVAQKMGRRYIGIEQLDYGENDSVVRLKNVIKGDQSGISKSVNWQGGGNFIYLELAKWNEEAKERILKAKSLNELEKFFDDLYERYFLNYNVKTREFKEKILKEEEFKKLGLDKQKKLFVEMLDMNQMYVNFSERADKKYNLFKKDIALSEDFYNTKK